MLTDRITSTRKVCYFCIFQKNSYNLLACKYCQEKFVVLNLFSLNIKLNYLETFSYSIGNVVTICIKFKLRNRNA